MHFVFFQQFFSCVAYSKLDIETNLALVLVNFAKHFYFNNFKINFSTINSVCTHIYVIRISICISINYNIIYILYL